MCEEPVHPVGIARQPGSQAGHGEVFRRALARLHQYSRARKPIDRYLAAIPDDPEALALHERILANLPAKPEPIPEPEEKHSSRRYPWE